MTLENGATALWLMPYNDADAGRFDALYLNYKAKVLVKQRGRLSEMERVVIYRL